MMGDMMAGKTKTLAEAEQTLRILDHLIRNGLRGPLAVASSMFDAYAKALADHWAQKGEAE